MREFSSRDFNQRHGTVKDAARVEPVSITENGRPTFVLMSQSDYERMASAQPTLLDRLADRRPEADFPFDPDEFAARDRDGDLV
ncbi:type II toxin-antitoxin system Phd/YefM family antitoxin [Mangrovibrevibacter kandeliae]|uniref:type II toxin-antitoxin system Phd/YefM family antitoxin n=1 Tax=Mangrovibrevibacter kandeliae TaxID=2968473 RepID=UPI002117767D|nr:type II toxin-antitoxin system Phd/YefM family antitoxin [Aurantimonas sp. CSK15Z-1]MCQ8784345.1 type II toxin-antitoxin system Phd/YefM family antitoxin [Aurantimonas sp. CSK15Z-1]